MQRRKFITTSVAAGIGSSSVLASNMAGKAEADQEFYELTRYHMVSGAKTKILQNYLKEALIPGLNKLGIEPVGAFSYKHGGYRQSKMTLIPYKSAEHYFEINQKLHSDKEFLNAAKPFINADIDDPVVMEYQKSFFKAFKFIPKLELPGDGYESRVFEFRTYQSQSYTAGQKKIEMFNEGGEIEIFRKTGLKPVFFGEALFDTRMPNLTYMIVFKSLADREKNWSKFINSSDWKQLSGMEEYKGIVSDITSLLLQPESYSQI